MACTPTSQRPLSYNGTLRANYLYTSHTILACPLIVTDPSMPL